MIDTGEIGEVYGRTRLVDLCALELPVIRDSDPGDEDDAEEESEEETEDE